MKLLSDLLYDARILEVRGTTHVAVEHIAIDSRQVQPLGLFVAIAGTTVDGHDYIDQAIQAGAACVLCERMPEHTPDRVTVIQVKSTASALGYVASAFHNHPSHDMKVVAVTGTNGKTTTGNDAGSYEGSSSPLTHIKPPLAQDRNNRHRQHF